MPQPKVIELTFNHGATLQFAWQMFYNRFTIEADGAGKIVSFASVHDGQAKEIVPVRFSREALIQLRQSVEKYLPGLVNAGEAPADTERLPNGVKRFSNLFSNHIRASHSGECAELALYTMPLSLVADEILGRRKGKTDMPLIGVALLHSTVAVHNRLLNRLLEGVPIKYGESEDDGEGTHTS